MLYRKCPICGANLDPGERCDCQRTPPDPEPALPMPRKAKATRRRENNGFDAGRTPTTLEDDYVQRAWQRWYEC